MSKKIHHEQFKSILNLVTEERRRLKLRSSLLLNFITPIWYKYSHHENFIPFIRSKSKHILFTDYYQFENEFTCYLNSLTERDFEDFTFGPLYVAPKVEVKLDTSHPTIEIDVEFVYDTCIEIPELQYYHCTSKIHVDDLTTAEIIDVTKKYLDFNHTYRRISSNYTTHRGSPYYISIFDPYCVLRVPSLYISDCQVARSSNVECYKSASYSICFVPRGEYSNENFTLSVNRYDHLIHAICQIPFHKKVDKHSVPYIEKFKFFFESLLNYDLITTESHVRIKSLENFDHYNFDLKRRKELEKYENKIQELFNIQNKIDGKLNRQFKKRKKLLIDLGLDQCAI